MNENDGLELAEKALFHPSKYSDMVDLYMDVLEYIRMVEIENLSYKVTITVLKGENENEKID